MGTSTFSVNSFCVTSEPGMSHIYVIMTAPILGGRHLGLRLFAVCRRGRRRRRLYYLAGTFQKTVLYALASNLYGMYMGTISRTYQNMGAL